LVCVGKRIDDSTIGKGIPDMGRIASLAHGRFPVATGLGGPSGLEDSLSVLARENRQRAESRKRT